MTDTPRSIEAEFSGSLGAFSLDVAFRVPMQGITGVFGASGSGKTTLLRCIAGLERLHGRLSVGGEIWQDDGSGRRFLRPHERPIGYVFQEASLFEHLSVHGNLLYGARRAPHAATDNEVDFDAIVELLGIAALLERAPRALSGGERQRVAVGRALLSRPRLLLMDEPLAALDRAAKDEILPYFEALHETLAIPAFYVSHEIAEIERLADELVLLDNGSVRASGELAALEADPELPLLQADEAAVTLESTVVETDTEYGLTSLAVSGGTLLVPGLRGSRGTRHRVRIQASDVSFARSRPEDSTILNCLPARISSLNAQDPDGNQLNVVANLGADGSGAQLVGRITRRSREALELTTGSVVFAQIKGVALLASGPTGAAGSHANGA